MRRKEGFKVLWLEMPVALAKRLTAVAKANRRSTNAEATVAIEQHVTAAEKAARKGGAQ
jgi:hypothetical protein